jgi:hypothetical protein
VEEPRTFPAAVLLETVQRHQRRILIPDRFDIDGFARREKRHHFELFILVELSLHIEQAGLEAIDESFD